ncbi:MAG: hypothetical protein ACLSWI_02565 [Candidatus Gastranaerophilaceae bacterium]
MNELNKKEILKQIEIMKEVLKINIETYYETSTELQAKLNMIEYLLIHD